MYGGGFYGCDGTIEGNRITANSADYRGGGLDNCLATIQNNIVTGNSATWNGGGLHACDGTMLNNTIVGNSAAYFGGGLDFCGGTIQNCIIWSNRAIHGAQLYDSSQPTQSCIQDWIGGGEGNIAQDPLFVDPDGADNNPDTHDDNNYRLSPDSHCIDAGQNEDWMWDAVDLDGNPRIVNGTVDIGAYEYRCTITGVGTGSAGEPVLTWTSRAGETYTVWSCTDLQTGEWNQEDSIAAQGASTTWIDADATLPHKFYKIEIK